MGAGRFTPASEANWVCGAALCRGITCIWSC
jgi:hypothetical protein